MLCHAVHAVPCHAVLCCAVQTGEDLNYLGVAGLRVAGGQGVAIIAFCQLLLMFG